MFPKNKINIVYRILCLICYSLVILLINNNASLIVLLILYCILALLEKSFRNIELIIISIILLWVSYLLKNYVLFRIILVIDYSFYFIDASYYIGEERSIVKENDYIRFKKVNKKNKKGLNNMLAMYLTVHLVVLLLVIVIGG